MNFAAIVTEHSRGLKKYFDGKGFVLEAWSDGKLLFQRAFHKDIRVLN